MQSYTELYMHAIIVILQVVRKTIQKLDKKGEISTKYSTQSQTRLERMSEIYAFFHCLDPAPTQQCATTANTTRTSCGSSTLGGRGIISKGRDCKATTCSEER